MYKRQRLISRVVPGFPPDRATRFLTRVLIRLDLPTFDRPTSAITGSPSVETTSPAETLVTNFPTKGFIKKGKSSEQKLEMSLRQFQLTFTKQLRFIAFYSDSIRVY